MTYSLTNWVTSTKKNGDVFQCLMVPRGKNYKERNNNNKYMLKTSIDMVQTIFINIELKLIRITMTRIALHT